MKVWSFLIAQTVIFFLTEIFLDVIIFPLRVNKLAYVDSLRDEGDLSTKATLSPRSGNTGKIKNRDLFVLDKVFFVY